MATFVNEGPRRKRLKVATACTECRRRKTKCDGAQPCANCIKSKSNCCYVSPSTSKPTTSPHHTPYPRRATLPLAPTYSSPSPASTPRFAGLPPHGPGGKIPANNALCFPLSSPSRSYSSPNITRFVPPPTSSAATARTTSKSTETSLVLSHIEDRLAAIESTLHFLLGQQQLRSSRLMASPPPPSSQIIAPTSSPLRHSHPPAPPAIASPSRSSASPSPTLHKKKSIQLPSIHAAMYPPPPLHYQENPPSAPYDQHSVSSLVTGFLPTKEPSSKKSPPALFSSPPHQSLIINK
ncbi:hypothetical protein DM01DRAFT_1411013 [Hesseltinella vesiculosa]|uniref:Zn(2)-C6 fungal-type domain-containing protein n=1 Tax=Hesseltinella vesiculosa TaxID=101127 RepID=A0A1X2G558_9FUNG|nr:hypothetical protein DM01DRAFT_1411013 [Hesseltinella vesiculosa]